ncbi:class I SAM-dependent RNA methyltransferase [Nitratireductor alexandrii]|uniref:class I SAM-dependent RNA methyltransferase n=1 Tax=Nitratireductor alexandrii TaxID=2448161 RepID=UPI000FDCC293|nr:class I SAM-dependent RNA methyltransferase [Nitratireductor alexandrii]
MTTRLRIDRLGAQGDGVADTEAGAVYVPFALPGELATVAVEADRGTLIAVVEPSAARVEPACRHFGECGGCALQHLDPPAYLAWKRDKLVAALASRGLEVEVGETVACEPGARRRAVFSARRTAQALLFGYNRAATHRLVSIEECPILVPRIPASFAALRELAALVCATDKTFRIAVSDTESGLDIAVSGAGKTGEKARRAAADFAIRQGFSRLALDGEVLIAPRPPQISIGGAVVGPPVGGFLQAVAAIETVIAASVVSHLGHNKIRRAADLFCGVGTFALRLAERAEILAVENDAAALAALDRGFRHADGLKRITTEKRDLFRRPLTTKELNRFDALVFDPPRAGAEAQARQIAISDVPRVAAVSCNPATLARDLRILVDGGYRLVEVTPFDQFLWSAHVEAVALLEKPAKKRR